MRTLKVFVAISLMVLSGCKLDHNKKVDREKFTFKTGDDTELFFKNLRQSDYDLEENKAAKFNVFRYEDRIVSEQKPIINLAIVINYLQDQAYILVEPNALLANEETLTVTISRSETEIILDQFNHQSMLEFASKIYEEILTDAQFSVMIDGQAYPILDNKNEREAFRITMTDYYRLVRIY